MQVVPKGRGISSRTLVTCLVSLTETSISTHRNVCNAYFFSSHVAATPSFFNHFPLGTIRSLNFIVIVFTVSVGDFLQLSFAFKDSIEMS